MAKRRRLSAPDAAQISVLNDPLEPPRRPSVAPIAQVAADVATRAAEDAVEARRTAAAAQVAAENWRAAEAEGRIAESISLGAIDVDHLTRDRVALDVDALKELTASIRDHGLRTPIDVVRLAGSTPRYGLISGWRRLHALRALFAETGDARFGAALAFVRTPATAADAYVAMVEENEIRADLSHYERGRIAVVAAGQGAYSSVEAAVAGLFASGSKAKRSKIRSFALIHEALGDLLSCGPQLGERLGLKIAQHLKEGGPSALRRHLGDGAPRPPADEIAVLEAFVADSGAPKDCASAEEMRAPPPPARQWRVAKGVTLTARPGASGATLEVKGAVLDEAVVERVVSVIQEALDADR